VKTLHLNGMPFEVIDEVADFFYKLAAERDEWKIKHDAMKKITEEMGQFMGRRN